MRSHRITVVVLILAACAVSILLMTIGPRRSTAKDVQEQRHSTIPRSQEPTSRSPSGATAAGQGPALDLAQVPPPRREAELSSPSGRVIDEETGSGVPGLVVQRKFTKRIVESATTGTDGRFLLTLREGPGRRLEVVPSPDWRVRERRIRMSDVQVSGAEEIVFHAYRVREAAIHGVVHDAMTKEPIPHLLLSFRQSGLPAEEVETDSEGNYRIIAKFSAGPVAVYAIDPPGLPGSLEFIGRKDHLRAGDDRLDLEANVGPTYTFDFQAPPELGVEVFDAVLIEPDEGHYLGQGEWTRVPVRAGTRPWARMRLPGRGPGAEAFWRIELQSRDGFWRGVAKVNSAVGIYPELLHIDLAASGFYRGKVTDDANRPLRDVRIDVRPFDHTTPGPFPRVFTTEADGLFEFPWLAPGLYSVATANNWYDPLYELVDTEALIAGGEITVQDLVMSRVESAGAVSGRLASQSGTHTFISTQLELRSRTQPNRRLVTMVRPQHEGGKSWAVFTFENVPDDEYELLIIGQGHRNWNPAARRVVPPTEDASFVLQDATSVMDIGFDVTDAATREPVGRFRLTWHMPDGSTERVEAQSSLEPALRNVAEGRALRWTVAVPGYQPVFGAEQDFTELIERDVALDIKLGLVVSPFRVASVELQSGWGVRLLVHGPDSEPLPGAHVLLDGEDGGVTGKDGSLVVSAATPPQIISVDYQDWVTPGGNVASYEAGFMSAWGEIEVQLQPPD